MVCHVSNKPSTSEYHLLILPCCLLITLLSQHLHMRSLFRSMYCIDCDCFVLTAWTVTAWTVIAFGS